MFDSILFWSRTIKFRELCLVKMLVVLVDSGFTEGTKVFIFTQFEMRINLLYSSPGSQFGYRNSVVCFR